jgi:sulfofructose kinase
MLPSKTAFFDVVGLGISPLDILALVDHFPVGDEVQQAFEISAQGGGPVATALVTLSRLGCRTAMIDAIGDDWRGKLILNEFHRERVCIDHICIRPGCTSAAASILVHKGSGERAIVHFPGSASELSKGELPLDILQRSKILHINGRHLQACQEFIATAKMRGTKISFDGGAGRYRPEIRHLIPVADYCIVAEQFAYAYTGYNSIIEAGLCIHNERPRLVVITAGIRGSWIFDLDGSVFHQSAFQMPSTVDTTGCGDSYHGAFLFGLLKEFTLHQTACFASAVGALNSQQLGGRAALPNYRTVIEFIEKQIPGEYSFPPSP